MYTQLLLPPTYVILFLAFIEDCKVFGWDIQF